MRINTFFNKATVVGLLLGLILSLSMPLSVLAQANNNSAVKTLLETAGGAAKYDTSKGSNPDSLAFIAGGVIKTFLSLLGIIFVVLMIYGGYIWMNARGNKEQVAKAIELIRDAIIGIIVIVAAYAITYFVLASIANGYITETGFTN